MVDSKDVKLLFATMKKVVKVYKTPQFKTMIKSRTDQDLFLKDLAPKWKETLLGLKVEGSSLEQEGKEIALKAEKLPKTSEVHKHGHASSYILWSR